LLETKEAEMLDFTELPSNGTAFEQLIRELLFVQNLSPRWTGKGPDQGRDLIAEETATGPLGSFRRRWLVECKHYAHSDKSVGRDDITSVVDNCRQINADGYLLACSTQPSSGLVQKLQEISAEPRNRLVTAVWDRIEVEKRLFEPRGFPLAHLFFPRSMAKTAWRVYSIIGSPTRWVAHYKDYFIYLSSRDSSYFPDLLQTEWLIDRLASIRPHNRDEEIRPRAVYFDDKHTQFHAFADYLVPERAKPSLRPQDFENVLHSWTAMGTGARYECPAGWDIKLVRTSPGSDHYHSDHEDYYKPYLRNFEQGIFRGGQLCDLVYRNNEWE
jgi:hypothetical protein